MATQRGDSTGGIEVKSVYLNAGLSDPSHSAHSAVSGTKKVRKAAPKAEPCTPDPVQKKKTKPIAVVAHGACCRSEYA
eukprot:5897692-Amphidinium_carterae.1